ncbi:MAG TPA: hypothetical protein VK737_01155 [Opitutales bacterium]|nr:hypothetical protein [Opitutales bacterium]
MRVSGSIFFFLLGAFALGGCSHAKSAGDVAKNGGLYNKFVPAATTSVVGKEDWADLKDAIAGVDLNREPYPVGSFLVARDAGGSPTAVLETTKWTGRQMQGVMVVSGTLTSGEEIVEPGPELARMVQENIDSYLVAHPAETAAATITATPAPAAAADTAAPAASTQK